MGDGEWHCVGHSHAPTLTACRRLAAGRERVALLQSVLQQALAERVAEREAAQQQAAAVWTLQVSVVGCMGHVVMTYCRCW